MPKGLRLHLCQYFIFHKSKITTVHTFKHFQWICLLDLSTCFWRCYYWWQLWFQRYRQKNPLNQLQNYCTYHKTVVWVDPKQYIKLLAVNQKMEFWLKLTVRTHYCLIHTLAILMDDSTQTKWGQILRDVEWICHWKRLWICSTTPPRIFY